MEENHKLKIIVKGAGYVFLGIFISKLFNYLYRMLIARYLGPESYGLLSLALVIISFATFFSLLGFDVGVMRYVAYFKGKDNNAKIKGVITSSLKVVFPLSILIFIICFLFSSWISITFYHDEKLGLLLQILSFSIPFFVVAFIFSSVFRAFQKIEYEIFTRQIFESIFKFIVTLIVVFLGYSIVGVTFVYLVSVIGVFLLALYFLEKKVFPIFKTKVISNFPKIKLFKYSLPLVFTGFFSMIFQWTDTLMIGSILSPTMTGIYNAAIPTSDLMYVIPFALLSLFIPVITELFAQKEYKSLERTFYITTKWIIYLNIPVFVMLSLFSKDIISILFGSQYISAAPSLSVLAFGSLVYSVVMTYNDYLKMAKKTFIILINTLLAAISNVILNLILIQKYGIMGAAITTVSSWIIFSILTVISVRTVTKIKLFYTNYIKALIGGCLGFLVVFLLKNLIENFMQTIIFKLFINSFIFLCVYVLFLFLFKGFEREDVEIMKAIKRRFFKNFM